MFEDIGCVVEINELMRRPEHRIDPDDESSTWPTEYFIVGMDIGTNFYCLNLSETRSPVYFWFHETNEFEVFASDLDRFVARVLEKYVRLRKQ